MPGATGRGWETGKGRPSKLTPERVDRLLDALRQGNYYEPACAVAGISYRTFRDWMIQGEQDIEAGRQTRFAQLVQDVARAEEEAEAEMIKMWRSHMPQDYRAVRDFLQRRKPERWGERLNIEHSGSVEHRLSAMSDEELAELAGEDA